MPSTGSSDYFMAVSMAVLVSLWGSLSLSVVFHTWNALLRSTCCPGSPNDCVVQDIKAGTEVEMWSPVALTGQLEDRTWQEANDEQLLVWKWPLGLCVHPDSSHLWWWTRASCLMIASLIGPLHQSSCLQADHNIMTVTWPVMIVFCSSFLVSLQWWY